MKNDVKEYYSIRNDQVFKSVFKDKDLIQALLKECLEEDVIVEEIKLTEMSKESIHEHGKILDLVVKVEGKIVNIEVNTSFNEKTRKRNFVYICKVHSSTTEESENYAKQPESIQINFNYNVGKKKKYKEVHEMRSKNGKKYKVGLKVIEINVDKFKTAWYNENISITRKYPMLTAISFDDRKSLDEYVRLIGNENVRRVQEKVNRINDDAAFISEISYCERLRNEGYYDGEEKGLKKGKKAGKIEAKLEMAKNLLQLGKLSTDDISACTGLSLTKIKKLKEEM